MSNEFTNEAYGDPELVKKCAEHVQWIASILANQGPVTVDRVMLTMMEGQPYNAMMQRAKIQPRNYSRFIKGVLEKMPDLPGRQTVLDLKGKETTGYLRESVEPIEEGATVAQALKHPKLDKSILDAARQRVLKAIAGTDYRELFINAHPKLKDYITKWMTYQLYLLVDDSNNGKPLPAHMDRVETANRFFNVFFHDTGDWAGVRDYLIAHKRDHNVLSKLNDSQFARKMLIANAEKWHEEMAEKADKDNAPKPAAGRTVLDCGDGYKWVSLDKGYCKQEGDAAGHCGNAANNPGDNILSLRDKDDRVCLTFIVNEKMLGETKGRGNKKPAKHYHKQIIKLLDSDLVIGIKGGGYLPESNFELSDLPKSEQERLVKNKPLLDLTAFCAKANVAQLKAYQKHLPYEVIDDNGTALFLLDTYENPYSAEFASQVSHEVTSSAWAQKYVKQILSDDSDFSDDYPYPDMSDLRSALSAQQENKLEDILAEEFPEEEYDDLEQLMDHFDGEGHELLDELKTRYGDAYRFGTEGARHKFVIKALEDGEDGAGVRFLMDGNKWRRVVRVSTFASDAASAELSLEDYKDNLSEYIKPLIDDNDLERDFTEFDAEYFRSEVDDLLNHYTVKQAKDNTGTVEPKINDESKQSVSEAVQEIPENLLKFLQDSQKVAVAYERELRVLPLMMKKFRAVEKRHGSIAVIYNTYTDMPSDVREALAGKDVIRESYGKQLTYFLREYENFTWSTMIGNLKRMLIQGDKALSGLKNTTKLLSDLDKDGAWNDLKEMIVWSEDHTDLSLFTEVSKRMVTMLKYLRWAFDFERKLKAWLDDRERNRYKDGAEVPPPSAEVTTLYHATPYLQQVLKEGFKVNTTQALGGATDNAICFTGSKFIARQIARCMREVIGIAKGEITREALVKRIKREGLYEKLKGNIAIGQREHDTATEDEKRQGVYELFRYYLGMHDKRYDPLFFGIDLKSFETLDRANVGVVAAKVRMDKVKRYLQAMQEYRVPPEGVESVQTLRESVAVEERQQDVSRVQQAQAAFRRALKQLEDAEKYGYLDDVLYHEQGGTDWVMKLPGEDKTVLLFRSVPPGHDKSGGYGKSKRGTKAIVLMYPNTVAQMEANFRKYPASWLRGKEDAFVHEYTHYSEDSRGRLYRDEEGNAPAGLAADRGDAQGYYNDPAEMQAYFVELAHAAADKLRLINKATSVYSGDGGLGSKSEFREKMFKTMLGDNPSQFLRIMKGSREHGHFLKALTPANYRKIAARAADIWTRLRKGEAIMESKGNIRDREYSVYDVQNYADHLTLTGTPLERVENAIRKFFGNNKIQVNPSNGIVTLPGEEKDGKPEQVPPEPPIGMPPGMQQPPLPAEEPMEEPEVPEEPAEVPEPTTA
jgi:hypothetical protein